MIAVDTNVLVYAHRAGLQGHDTALAWLDHLATGSVPWGIPVFCLAEFVRVTTHPRILDPPSTLEESLAALSALLTSPTVRVLNPGSRYPTLLEVSLRFADARGNLAFDAQIAAVCLEQGASRLLTLDRDFARFSDLQILTPEQPPR